MKPLYGKQVAKVPPQCQQRRLVRFAWYCELRELVACSSSPCDRCGTAYCCAPDVDPQATDTDPSPCRANQGRSHCVLMLTLMLVLVLGYESWCQCRARETSRVPVVGGAYC